MPPPIERVDLCEQAAEQVELGRHLGPADDRRERTDRDLQYFRERLELLLGTQNRSSRNGTAKIISRPTCHHEPLDGRPP
jgi:hypothetical protein